MDQACALFDRLTELSDPAGDGQRGVIMRALVERVEMADKEKGTCRIALRPHVPYWLGSTSKMGAGIDAGSIYPNSLTFHFVAPQGGQSRKRVPRTLTESKG